ncbi:P-loop containing nucleoside triphosphate hydrolases superfamily protein [Rhynchospora pubera]|uniref:P-loop containing nucleoside triphosphate hydrolases superfamily protein n=2 Tax=Rhynchospora pubera TaxID=906938 RepID=A0AAV8DUK3_9POAL|nr:P-loop containing nucleoside triphosphate hydrolases superfamily protein [Rhynchospora pubera]
MASSPASNQLTLVVEESDGFSPNRMYKVVQSYLVSIAVSGASTARRLCITVPYDGDDNAEVRSEAIQITVDTGEEVVDFYQEAKFLWRVAIRESFGNTGQFFYSHGDPTEVKYFELTFDERYREFAIKSYIPYILEQAKTIRLWTNNEDAMWKPAKLRQVATLNTLAMKEEKKKALIDDLSKFVQKKEYYNRIGKAWQRRYVLFGPPGTGKSTLIAAMANFLRFDIYNLELTKVTSNDELRSLLINTTNSSILVIENIKCSVELQEGEKEKKPTAEGSANDDESKITLSGLLNIVDGLWSDCGDERIIIITANYKEMFDPALLRPGRMDILIHMGYCDSSVFRVLASYYHSLTNHPLFSEIGELIEVISIITPAEVAEALMRSDDAEIALKGLMDMLNGKDMSFDHMVIEALWALKKEWGTRLLEHVDI